MAIKITKQTSTANTTIKKGRKIEYIVVHYTAGTKSTAGVAKSVASMFANPSRQASADFIVDDEFIVQYNGDIANRYTWAVGGSKYTNPSTTEGGKYYNKCRNDNSISIEMCSSKKNTKTLNATDTDWYITKATEKNTIELVKYLMDKYNIDANHVIIHHHVTGKICPNPYCVNEKALINWKAFKLNLKTTYSVTTTIDGVRLFDKLGGEAVKKYEKGTKLNVSEVVVYDGELYGKGLKTQKWFRLKYTKEV